MKLAFWGILGQRPLARVQGFYPRLVHDGFKLITTEDGTETIPSIRASCGYLTKSKNYRGFRAWFQLWAGDAVLRMDAMR